MRNHLVCQVAFFLLLKKVLTITTIALDIFTLKTENFRFTFFFFHFHHHRVLKQPSPNSLIATLSRQPYFFSPGLLSQPRLPPHSPLLQLQVAYHCGVLHNHIILFFSLFLKEEMFLRGSRGEVACQAPT